MLTARWRLLTLLLLAAVLPALPGAGAGARAQAAARPARTQPAKAADPIALRPVRWQILPGDVERVDVGPDERVWLGLRRGYMGGIEKLKEQIAEQFAKPMPQLSGVYPVLFEQGGRVWFRLPIDRLVLGYDGATWIERACGQADQWSYQQAGGGRMNGRTAYLEMGKWRFLSDSSGVHMFDGQEWTYQNLGVTDGTGSSSGDAVGAGSVRGIRAEQLLPERDGKGVIAVTSATNVDQPALWRWREGKWTMLATVKALGAGGGCPPRVVQLPDGRLLVALRNFKLRQLDLGTGAPGTAPANAAEPPKDFKRLVENLASDTDRIHDSALEQLKAMGPGITPFLRKALEKETNELRRDGLEQLLKGAGVTQPSAAVRIGAYDVAKLAGTMGEIEGRILIGMTITSAPGAPPPGDGDGPAEVVDQDAVPQADGPDAAAIAAATPGTPGAGLLVIDTAKADAKPRLLHPPAETGTWAPDPNNFRALFPLVPGRSCVIGNFNRQPAPIVEFGAGGQVKVSYLPDASFNEILATRRDGTIFATPSDGRRGAIGVYRPDQPEDRKLVKSAAAPVLPDAWALASDGQLWALRPDGGLWRYDGQQWAKGRDLPAPVDGTYVIAGRGGAVLAGCAGGHVLLVGEQAYSDGSLPDLIAAQAATFAKAFAGTVEAKEPAAGAAAPPGVYGGGLRASPYNGTNGNAVYLTADKAGNLWLLRDQTLRVLFGGEWHDTTEALTEADTEHHLTAQFYRMPLRFLAAAGDGSKVYVSNLQVAPQGALAFLARVERDKVVFAPAPQAAAPPVRDGAGALWMTVAKTTANRNSGYSTSGIKLMRVTEAGLAGELAPGIAPALVDGAGAVWTGPGGLGGSTAGAVSGTEFTCWRDGREAGTARAQAAGSAGTLASDRAGSLWLWTYGGLEHLTADGAAEAAVTTAPATTAPAEAGATEQGAALAFTRRALLHPQLLDGPAARGFPAPPDARVVASPRGFLATATERHDYPTRRSVCLLHVVKVE